MIPGYLMHDMSRHESQTTLACSSISLAKDIMDLVRAVNNRPRASATLRCLANVKASDNRLMQIAERRADELVSMRLSKIKGLVGSEGYCLEVGKFRQELRYLWPAVGRSARGAEQALLAIERSVQDRDPSDVSESFARERRGG